MTPELRLLVRQKLEAHRQLTKDPSNSSLREHFIVLRRNATKLSRALKARHFMDMCNEHSKSPRKLWSLLNSLTGRVKSHPPPRATLNSLSETFAVLTVTLAVLSTLSRLQCRDWDPLHQWTLTGATSTVQVFSCICTDGAKSFTKHRPPQSHWTWWYS